MLLLELRSGDQPYTNIQGWTSPLLLHLPPPRSQGTAGASCSSQARAQVVSAQGQGMRSH